ncbi:unnamed protein product [Rotaria sp. Silwood1]|nr:unnamed protein product [Rotaria sp. Silwood1]
MVLLQTINALKADLYETNTLIDKNSIACQVLGFFTYETFGCFYMTFVLQAFYRLTRVGFSFNLICIQLQWIIYFLLILPSYFWSEPFYSLHELNYYCGIRYENILGLSYTIMNIFFLPPVYLLLIYARLVYFIRYQASQLSEVRKRRRAHRDFMVTRRILFTVVVIILPGLPNLAFAIMTNIHLPFSGSYYMYRIQFMGPTVTVFIVSIVIAFITRQIKQILIKLKFHGNPVAPMTLSMEEPQHSTVHLSRPIQG